MSSVLAFRSAAILLWFAAAGFGLPCLLAIRNLITGRGIPTVLGFPAYGGGPLERLGIETNVWLIGGFLLVCVLEAAAGWLLWSGERAGAILSLALLLPGAFYWWGFALPVPPLLALVRTALVLINWRNLH